MYCNRGLKAENLDVSFLNGVKEKPVDRAVWQSLHSRKFRRGSYDNRTSAIVRGTRVITFAPRCIAKNIDGTGHCTGVICEVGGGAWRCGLE